MTTLGSMLIGTAVLCGVAFFYPYLLYPLALRLMPVAKPLRSQQPVAGAEHFAVLFSAFNEESSAREKLTNLKQLIDRHAELLVRIYDDGSTDRTAEIFSELGPHVVLKGAGRAGKATGMAELVASTERQFLLFTDANVILDVGVIGRAAQYFADPSVGGICGHLEYEALEGTSTQVAGGAYWKLEERIKRLESRTGNVMGGDGSIFVMRRDLYPQVPESAQDDLTATMNVVFSGQRLVIASDVVAHEKLVSKSHDEYRRKVRIAARAMHTHMNMRAQLSRMTTFDRWKYYSHKVLRWYGAFFIVLGIIAGVSGLLVLDPLVGLAVGSLLVSSSVLVVLLPKLAPFKEIAIAIAATGQGVILARSGATYPTWTPPDSR